MNLDKETSAATSGYMTTVPYNIMLPEDKISSDAYEPG